jgi:hypothetical protein
VGVLFFGLCGLIVLLLPLIDFRAAQGRPRHLLNLLATLVVIAFIGLTAWGLLEK